MFEYTPEQIYPYNFLLKTEKREAVQKTEQPLLVKDENFLVQSNPVTQAFIIFTWLYFIVAF